MRNRTGAPRLPSLQVRVGTDFVPVASVAESIQTFDSRHLERVYTRAELSYCAVDDAELSRLPARFVTREATLKVLRPRERWFGWRDIEIVKSPGGWCELRLHGLGQRLRRCSGILKLAVSLSHKADYAVATVAATLHTQT